MKKCTIYHTEWFCKFDAVLIEGRVFIAEDLSIYEGIYPEKIIDRLYLYSTKLCKILCPADCEFGLARLEVDACKWGFVDIETGMVKIPPTWDYAAPFCNDFAIVANECSPTVDLYSSISKQEVIMENTRYDDAPIKRVELNLCGVDSDLKKFDDIGHCAVAYFGDIPATADGQSGNIYSHDFKVIHGCETYFSTDDGTGTFLLMLLVRNAVGLHNLRELNGYSKLGLDIRFEDLKTHHEGLDAADMIYALMIKSKYSSSQAFAITLS